MVEPAQEVAQPQRLLGRRVFLHREDDAEEARSVHATAASKALGETAGAGEQIHDSPAALRPSPPSFLSSVLRMPLFGLLREQPGTRSAPRAAVR